MEERKDNFKENSAIEKVENASLTTETAPPAKRKPGVKKASAMKKKPETGKKTEKQTKKTNEQVREEKAKAKYAAAEEKKKKQAEAKKKREQAKKARIEAKKAKAAARKEKQRSLRELRIAKKEERIKRREFLKNESKEDRQKRLAAEKQAKLKIKAQKAERRAELKKAKAERAAEMKRQKQAARHERKMKKAEMRERRGRENRSRGVGGWLAAVISLGCSVLVLGSVLALSLFTDVLSFGKKDGGTEAAERAFYDLVGYVDNIETNMSKLFVASDSESQQKILGDLMVQSNLADSSLAALPVMDESKHYASKYINQVGDYAKYLNNRLIDQQTLTNEDLDRLVELYNVNTDLKEALTTLSARVNEEYDFDLLKDNNANDIIIAQFNDFEKGAVDYPEMIYDGAFSDGVNNKEVKGLSGEEIDETAAVEKFNKIFAEYGELDPTVMGMTENSEIICYNVTSMTEGGEIYAQISKIGGELVMFNAYRECGEEKLSEEECIAKAGEFLEKLGYKDMKCVWNYASGGTEHLNFAYTENGVVMYPDLVKLNVCMETGVVTGLDADNYYINHTDRLIGKAKHDMGEAFDKVNVKLDVQDERVTVIPLGNGRETLAYEFIGTYNGSVYYVYVDADTLKEVEIYKVVDTEQGRLLM
ncbi:MAG: germination protein YpeB [Candidatus Borkfalkiaceae bacterium]|nr:germination protein YpeB [Christensenellaceae bacterium]